MSTVETNELPKSTISEPLSSPDASVPAAEPVIAVAVLNGPIAKVGFACFGVNVKEVIGLPWLSAVITTWSRRNPCAWLPWEQSVPPADQSTSVISNRRVETGWSGPFAPEPPSVNLRVMKTWGFWLGFGLKTTARSVCVGGPNRFVVWPGPSLLGVVTVEHGATFAPWPVQTVKVPWFAGEAAIEIVTSTLSGIRV